MPEIGLELLFQHCGGSFNINHCSPVPQKNMPLLQRRAFRAVSYLAWKPTLLDELTSFGQREFVPAILRLH